MKKILFLVAFFSFASFASVNAQTKAAPVAKKLEAAVEAAKNDPSIIQKVGEDGKVTFKKKSVCAKSGKVSFAPVQYNAKTKSWDKAKAASCSTKKGKSCCSGKKAKSCGSSSKAKSSCSGKKAKSCGSKKKS